MTTDIRFSLILPLYRNEANLPALLQCISEMQTSLGAGFEAVFVVDGHPDNGKSTSRACCRSGHFNPSGGCIRAILGSLDRIRSGLKAALGNFMPMMAADLQVYPEPALKFAQTFELIDANFIVEAENSGRDPVEQTHCGTVL